MAQNYWMQVEGEEVRTDCPFKKTYTAKTMACVDIRGRRPLFKMYFSEGYEESHYGGSHQLPSP